MAFFKALAKARASAKKDGGTALRELRGQVFAPATHKNLRRQDADVAPPSKQATSTAPTRTAAAAPTPDPADPAEAEIRRRAACCLALAMGTHNRLGIQSRVHELRGHDDVFRLIAEHAEMRTTEWFARPLPKELPTLRRHLRLEHGERRMAEELLSDAHVTIEELRTQLTRALRREQSAVAAANCRVADEKARAEEVREGAAEWQRLQQRAWDERRKEERREDAQAARAEIRWLMDRLAEAQAELQQQKRAAEIQLVDRLRDQDVEMRARGQRLAAARDQAEAERREADGLIAQLEQQHREQLAAMERLRNARNGSALERQAALEVEVQRLKARRKATQLKVSDVNLARRATDVAQQQLQKERAVLRDFWGSGLDYAARAKEIESENASLVQKLKDAQADLKAAQGEAAKYRAVAEPAKSKFFEAGHFSAAVDQIIIECLSLGVARNKLPQLFMIFARFYGILIPGRKKKVPGPWVDGRRTTVERYVYYLPGKSHVKEMAAVMNQLNKLQMGEWLLQHIESDEETSCCYLADGAESQQVDYLGQLLSRRVNGKLEIKALDLNKLGSKTADAQAAAFRSSLEEIAELMLKAGLVDNRAADLLRRFMPTCTMNDRASPARKAARLVLRRALGLDDDGDDDPTCAEHALVNILEEGRKAIDKVLREMMNISDEQAAGDEAKIKAMRTCVGWFSSPACALIYQVRITAPTSCYLLTIHTVPTDPAIPTRQVAKYCALCSSKGYAIGQKFAEWIEARLADGADEAELLGHAEDLLAICGSRMYVFFLDAAVTERLLSQVGSLLTFLEEEDDLQAEGGGKLRKSILTGTNSPACMAAVRSMALLCESVLWPLLKAVKPSAEQHTLDVLPQVWPAACGFFRDAAARPRGLIEGSLELDLGTATPAQATPATAAQARRSQRAAIDMARIRATIAADPQQGELVEKLLAAACEAMAKATANHAAEWLPAGLEATDGSITVDGKLCAARITPELRARYDALPTTSTSVERLHAFGRGCDEQAGLQRADTRAGICLGRYNGQAEWLRSKSTEELRMLLNVSRQAARALLRKTIKAQRVEAGRAKRVERDAKLSSKRAKREARAAELKRIEALRPATKYSELVSMANADLADQLKYHKVVRKQTGFTVTQKDRKAYVLQLQSLLSDWHTDANDLESGDAGVEGRGIKRKANAPAEGERGGKAGGKAGGGKAGKKAPVNVALDEDGNEIEWEDGDECEVEAIVGTRTSAGPKADKSERFPKGTALYRVVWKGWAADEATWEPAAHIHPDLLAEYEAGLDAEAELEAEEERELAAEEAEEAEEMDCSRTAPSE